MSEKNSIARKVLKKNNLGFNYVVVDEKDASVKSFHKSISYAFRQIAKKDYRGCVIMEIKDYLDILGKKENILEKSNLDLMYKNTFDSVSLEFYNLCDNNGITVDEVSNLTGQSKACVQNWFCFHRKVPPVALAWLKIYITYCK